MAAPTPTAAEPVPTAAGDEGGAGSVVGENGNVGKSNRSTATVAIPLLVLLLVTVYAAYAWRRHARKRADANAAAAVEDEIQRATHGSAGTPGMMTNPLARQRSAIRTPQSAGSADTVSGRLDAPAPRTIENATFEPPPSVSITRGDAVYTIPMAGAAPQLDNDGYVYDRVVNNAGKLGVEYAVPVEGPYSAAYEAPQSDYSPGQVPSSSCGGDVTTEYYHDNNFAFSAAEGAEEGYDAPQSDYAPGQEGYDTPQSDYAYGHEVGGRSGSKRATFNSASDGIVYAIPMDPADGTAESAV